MIRAVCVASFTGLMIWIAGPDPALALPAAAPMTRAEATLPPPSLWHVARHRHHGHWRHWHGRSSRYAPFYGQAPEMNAAETPAVVPGYAPYAGSSQPVPTPPATSLNRNGAAPAQSPANRGGETPSSARPSIQWVDPDRSTR
jgi:hypothetical protein